jgi:dihydropteroate synthase
MTEPDVMAPFAAQAWVHAIGVLPLERPRVMAVVNLTPDSFYDGGILVDQRGSLDVEGALDRCRQAILQGADILDIGGESTRPGATAVPMDAELRRVLPVIEGAAALDPNRPVSIDTRRAAVARRAIEAGAAIVNDVSGLADPDMDAVVADSAAGLVIGHLRGDPSTMHAHICFVDVLREVTDELARAVDRAVARGIARPRIVVDPGIGFGKSAEHSAALVAASGWLRQATGCAVLVGASRKSFLGAITQEPVQQRLAGSLAAAVIAVQRGASIIRVHDVRETVAALAVAASIQSAYERHAAAAAAGEEGLQ